MDGAGRCLSGRVVDSCELGRGDWEVILESSFSFVCTSQTISIFFLSMIVRGIVTAESDQVLGQDNTQLASSFSYNPAVCVLWWELWRIRHVRAGKASTAHPARPTCRYRTEDLYRTCPNVQVIGGAFPKPRPPLCLQHILLCQSALVCPLFTYMLLMARLCVLAACTWGGHRLKVVHVCVCDAPSQGGGE